MMQDRLATPDRVPICDATSLANGGFAGDTELLTTDGLTTIAELEPGAKLLALNPMTRVCKLKRVVDVETVDPPIQAVRIQTRRADILVSPTHRIPYTTTAIDQVRMMEAGSLKAREAFQFINDWRSPTGQRLTQFDLTDYCTDYEMNAEFEAHGTHVRSILPDGCEPVRRNTETGYYFDSETFSQYQNDIEALADSVKIHAGPKHWRRPYRFDGDDFIEFLGWFVTEGSVTWLTDSDSATIGIAQKTEPHRQEIAALLNRMGLEYSVNNNGFAFSSKLFGRLLERLCGTGSATKRLPELVWDCSVAQKRLLLETLMNGDGNGWSVYYTISERLRADILRLLLELGMKPRYSHTKGNEIYLSTENDGFTSSRNVTRTFVDGPMYKLAVEDFSTVMAGRRGRFQWVGVSAVA